MLSPLVSFIIPFFNSGETIQETIDSIFNQSYENFDVWIINDGSTEINALEKLKEFESNPQINILHQENAGPGKARNLAANYSTAEYYVFLDSDDLIYKESLDFLLSEMIETDDILYGNCSYFGEKSGLKKQTETSTRDILVGNPIALCSLIRASSFDQIKFDENLDKLGLEDWELFISMLSRGMMLRYLNSEPLFEIRVSLQSRTWQVANKNSNDVLYYISKKHHKVLYEHYKAIHQELKQEKELIDRKIGQLVMMPYRFIKKIITR